MTHIVTRKFSTMPTGLLAVMVLAALFATAAFAQTTLQGQIGIRPLSRDDIAANKLPATTDLSGGLATVGIGMPVYLEAQVTLAVNAADITDVAWEISSKPANSAAVLADSPL